MCRSNLWRSAIGRCLSSYALIAVGLFIGLDLPILAAEVEDEKPAKANPAGAPRRFEFHIQTTDGKPVEGAKIYPWAVLCNGGSFAVQEKRVPAVKSDVDGKATIVFPHDAELEADDERTSKLLRDGLNQGLRQIAIRVDHPDHPIYSQYVDAGGPRRIELVDSTTIVVRIDQSREPRKGGALYPVLSRTFWLASNFSADEGVLTIRRVDRTSDQASQWLRVVELTDDGGPARFSDLIDLNSHRGNPVNLDIETKPGARVVGRLAGDVPRPVKNGFVVGQIVGGPNSWEGWSWGVKAEIDQDGKFTIDSLPPNDNLQLIALCDGWVSTSPTIDELNAYQKEHGFNVENPVLHSGHVQPRLLRLTSGTIVRGISMQPTATCEVKVVDADGMPVSGASVSFWPNQFWFRGGAQVLGTGFDTLSFIRDELAKKDRLDLSSALGRQQRFSAKTNDQGLALISNLPAGGDAESDEEREYPFYVEHETLGEKVALGAKSESVRIAPAGTGHVTVRLKRK